MSSSNALAAHLWPIITELMMGPEAPTLLPYATAINHRKHLGLPGHYFGNCATFRQAEPATADEGLTSLALKVRFTPVVYLSAVLGGRIQPSSPGLAERDDA